MPLSLDSRSFKAIPSARLSILAALALLLLLVDAAPESAFDNPDQIQFALSVAIGATAIALSLVDRLTRTQLVAMRNRGLLLMVALSIATVGAEYATRLIFRDVTTSTDNSGFFTRRWLRSRPSRRNAAGFRGPSYSDTKPPGTYRIAIVGDSFTFGNGIRQEDRFSDLLQAQLPSRIEVLNFGEPGANTPEHEKRVEEVLRTVHPDFILLQWYVNDMEDDDVTGRPAPRPLVPPMHDWLNARSALYNVANIKWAETQVRLGWQRSYVDYINDRLSNPHGQSAQSDNRHLRALIDHSRTAGVPIGIVLFPDTAAPLNDSYPFGYLHDRVLATCADYGMTCVDLRQDFAKVKDHRQLWASRFDHHASARANVIAAERILSTFAAKWASLPSR
jgi:hypothetical protein